MVQYSHVFGAFTEGTITYMLKNFEVKSLDRTTAGFTAGIIGSLVMNSLNYISFYILGLASLRYWDWTAIIFYGHRTTNIIGVIFAQIFQILLSGLLGIVFAFLISRILTGSNYIFKGWVFGVFMWFFFYAVVFLFRVPELTIVPINTVISNFVTSSVYGIVTSYALNILEKKIAI